MVSVVRGMCAAPGVVFVGCCVFAAACCVTCVVVTGCLLRVV